MIQFKVPNKNIRPCLTIVIICIVLMLRSAFGRRCSIHNYQKHSTIIIIASECAPVLCSAVVSVAVT